MGHSPEMKDTMNMTAATLGKDLLGALVQEIRLMPDLWIKLSEKKQQDVIDRLAKRVDAAVKMAVHLIASNGRTVVVGDLEKVTIKDGVKAEVKIGRTASGLYELTLAQGRAILLVVASDEEEFTNGMDEVRGESDQRSFDLGKEYTDADGEGMDDNVVDAEVREVPAIEQQPLQEELDAARQEGYDAAGDGKVEADCPIQAGPLCIEWIKGWKAWHDEQSEGNDPIYDDAVAYVVATQRISISALQREFGITFNRADRLIDRLEAEGVISAADETGARTVLHTPGQEG